MMTLTSSFIIFDSLAAAQALVIMSMSVESSCWRSARASILLHASSRFPEIHDVVELGLRHLHLGLVLHQLVVLRHTVQDLRRQLYQLCS